MIPWVETIAAVVLVVNVAGWLHAAHALMRSRTAEGTIAWVMCLIVLPYIAIPLYWVLERSRFQGYILARRAKDGPLAHTFMAVREALVACEHFEDPPHPLLRPSAKLADLPVTTGNDLELLAEGKEAFERMFEDISKAEHYILVLFFIVKGDDIGQRFKEALIDRAKTGVRVYFLYDEFGSRKLPDSYLEDLTKAGAEPVAFATQLGKGNRFQINFRNHRKILVVDGHVAFSGGMNIGEEYAGAKTDLGFWRDSLIRIEGPAAQCMQLIFAEDWNWATGSPPPNLIWETPDVARCQRGEGYRTLVIPTGPADVLDSCHLFFLEAIAVARRRIWITSPYFVPDRAVVAALQAAAVRGVDVRIMLPNDPDHLLVYLSSFSFLHEMDLAGVGVYRFENGFLHQKVMLIDHELASVGTANFDNRSFRLNFEVITLVHDQAFAKEVEALLVEDFSHCRKVTAREYTQKPIWFRIGVRLARLMTPVQ